MNYTVKIVSLPAKEFLVIKDFIELESNNDSYSDTRATLEKYIADGSVERLKKVAGSDIVYGLFCNSCVKSENSEGWICGNDIACENVNGVTSDNDFEVVSLLPSEYVFFDCNYEPSFNADKEIDDIYWGEWLINNPYESMIELETGADTPGIAVITYCFPLDRKADTVNIKTWYPIRRKENV